MIKFCTQEFPEKEQQITFSKDRQIGFVMESFLPKFGEKMTKCTNPNFNKLSSVHVDGMNASWIQALKDVSEILYFEVCTGNDWL